MDGVAALGSSSLLGLVKHKTSTLYRRSRQPLKPILWTGLYMVGGTGHSVHVNWTSTRAIFVCPHVVASESEVSPSALLTNFYKGDVDALEENTEEPPKYVPPPNLDCQDAEIIGKTENVLYALKDFLCYWEKNHEIKWENYHTIWKLLSTTVEFQDPLICFRGLKSLIWWLQALSDATFSISLDGLYSENQASNSSKPEVYILWTVMVTEDQEMCFRNLGVWDWWREKSMALHQELCMLQVHSGRRLQVSGETKLEIDSLGQISSICTSWYSMGNEPEQLQGFVRLLLVALLSRNVCWLMQMIEGKF